MTWKCHLSNVTCQMAFCTPGAVILGDFSCMGLKAPKQIRCPTFPVPGDQRVQVVWEECQLGQAWPRTSKAMKHILLPGADRRKVS